MKNSQIESKEQEIERLSRAAISLSGVFAYDTEYFPSSIRKKAEKTINAIIKRIDSTLKELGDD